VELIARAVVDEPPLAVKEGGLIRDGFDAGLDELRRAPTDRRPYAPGGSRLSRGKPRDGVSHFAAVRPMRDHARLEVICQ
jgi:hypothetical protein